MLNCIGINRVDNSSELEPSSDDGRGEKVKFLCCHANSLSEYGPSRFTFAVNFRQLESRRLRPHSAATAGLAMRIIASWPSLGQNFCLI
ncbi:unnamed protein product [Protopolystoma xenopodis]|uniref:Uncharacterized protein n=1 Tax=Protopolystoma xenopodis TaxID=117903 RepID=A0A3S5AWR9_9PLAT|nr:unnamed protein product [Protopolystoma xenopodis]